MSDIVSIAHLHKNFKSVAEWQDFAEKQLIVINSLQTQLNTSKEEIEHLKKMLRDLSPLEGQGLVEKIIVSPERALLDDQILMIQSRSYGQELSLEDVKKIDLLIKNKRLLIEAENNIKGHSKKLELSSEELLKLASPIDPHVGLNDSK